MRNKVGIIICYFGSLPAIFELWRRSCEYNEDFDFLLFTDQKVQGGKDNIKVIPCTLGDVRNLAKMKLKVENIELESAYKLCDFKPMYGVIFEDYLVPYDFWGMCDIDMIFGSLCTFITDEILDRYEKVYQLGHLTLYRNSTVVNHRFKLDGYTDWKFAITTKEHCRLCERGMIEKYQKAGIPVYTARDYADISKIHKRYQLSHWLVPKGQKDWYRHQVYYYEGGHVYRAFYYKGAIFTQEFNYIHLQKRKVSCVVDELGDCFFIAQNRIIKKEPGVPSKEMILQLNPFPGYLFELFECIAYEIRHRNILKRYVALLHEKWK